MDWRIRLQAASLRWGFASIGGVAVVASIIAAITTGTARMAAIFATLVLGSLLPLLALLWGDKDRRETPLGGSGYGAPQNAALRFVHVALAIWFNLGIMVVVLAILARYTIVEVEFEPGVLQGFPIAVGIFVLLMALAAKWGIASHGAIRHAWYTRTHGIFLGAALGVIVALFVAVAALAELSLGGLISVGPGDLVVLALIGLLGIGTQLFLALDIPTIFALATRAAQAPKRAADDASGTPPFVYAAVIALGSTAIIGFVAWRFDIMGALGDFKDQRVALVLLLFPVLVGAFFAASAIQIYREGRRGLYKQKIPRDVRTAILVYGLSLIGGLIGSTLLIMNLMGQLDGLGPIPAGSGLSKDLIAFTIIVTAAPIGFYTARRTRRVDAIEERIPDFLNDLAETKRAGLTMAAALQSTALSDYGPLSEEVKKMADQVTWGVPFSRALEEFSKRVPTALVQRIAFLIIEASRTGGSVAEILKAAAADAYEIKALESERRVTMATYLIVLYVVYFVFLGVLGVLAGQFIPQMLEANRAVAESSLSGGGSFGGGKAGLSQESLEFSYFTASVVQAIGNGLVAGVLAEGRALGGLRHVAVMATAAYVLFRFALG